MARTSRYSQEVRERAVRMVRGGRDCTVLIPLGGRWCWPSLVSGDRSGNGELEIRWVRCS